MPSELVRNLDSDTSSALGITSVAGVQETEEQLTQRLYNDAAQSQEDWMNTAVQNLEYYGGEHWTAEQKKTLEQRGQMPADIQMTWQIVEQAIAMLTANRPSYQASGRATGDQDDARVWSDLFQWVWQQSNGQECIKSIFRDNYVQGRGVSLVYTDWNADFGKGEVKFVDIDPKDVFPDPNSKHVLCDDAEYIIVKRVMPLGRIARIWGEGVAEEVARSGIIHEERYAGSKARVANTKIIDSDIVRSDNGSLYDVFERYTKVSKRHYRLLNPDTNEEEILTEAQHNARLEDLAFIQQTSDGNREIITDSHNVSELEALYNGLGLSNYDGVFHIERGEQQIDEQGEVQEMPPVPAPGPEGDNALPGTEVQLVPVEVGELVASGAVRDIPFDLTRVLVHASSGDARIYEPEMLPTSHYPLIFYPSSHNRNPYPIAEVSRMRSPQDIINKTMSLILAHAASSTNLKVFVPRNSSLSTEELKAEWGRAGAAFFEYDTQFGGERGGVDVVAPPPLPSALYQNLDRAILLMERIAGIFSLQQGDASSAPQTYNATLAIDEFGLRRIKGKLDSLYTSLRRQGQVIMDFAQHVYTEEKVLRLLMPSGERVETVINSTEPGQIEGVSRTINNITKGTYDVIILAGSTLPNNRWALLQTYMELYERNLVDDIAVLRKTELPDAEEILSRNSMYARMRQAIEELQNEVSDLEGDLQTAQREALHSEQRAILAKFSAKLSGIASKTQSALGAGTEIFENSLQTELDKQKEILKLQRTNQQGTK